MNLCRFQRLFQSHRWQNGRHPFRQHGLARTGRTNHQDIVTATDRQLILTICCESYRFATRSAERCLLQNDTTTTEYQRIATLHQSSPETFHSATGSGCAMTLARPIIPSTPNNLSGMPRSALLLYRPIRPVRISLVYISLESRLKMGIKSQLYFVPPTELTVDRERRGYSPGCGREVGLAEAG